MAKFDYLELDIINNLDFFFEKTKIQKLCLKDATFLKNFEQLYSTVLSIVLRSEFISQFTPKIWKVIFDCFGITF